MSQENKMDVMFCGLIWFKLKSSFSAPVERAALAELCKHTSQIWGEDAARRVIDDIFNRRWTCDDMSDCRFSRTVHSKSSYHLISQARAVPRGRKYSILIPNLWFNYETSLGGSRLFRTRLNSLRAGLLKWMKESEAIKRVLGHTADVWRWL